MAEHVQVLVRSCAPDPERGARWGDTHFAESLVAAFERLGHPAAHATIRDWDAPTTSRAEAVVHLRGLEPARPRPGAMNVLWIISHHDAVTLDEIEAHDLCLVASGSHAEHLRRLVRTPVHTMHQATDAARFHPPLRGSTRPPYGVVVVANARLPYRTAPRWLHESRVPFVIYGAKWERYPEHRHVVADYVANDELSEVYAAAGAVVADQWEHMARDGFVANRLFDVLASGGFCVSDDGPGVREVFGGIVPTYGSRAELLDVLRRFREDREERARRVHRGLALVRSKHTFDHRAAEIVDLAELRLR